MLTPDEGLRALERIGQNFHAFCTDRGRASEADTRAKLIDRILVDVLGWPESEVVREQASGKGFTDYNLLVNHRQYITVEAKREGIAFVLPAGLQSRRLKLDGTLTKSLEVREAIDQVRGYADELGIRYAVATNGYSWIVFRAIREDVPWRTGSARVFNGLDDVARDFTAFWNLLSYDAVQAGGLEAEFGAAPRLDRLLDRVIDDLVNADVPLQRNRLHAQLAPISKAVFENIADQDAVEILHSCYVHTGSLRIVADDLNLVITDALPQFLEHLGAEPVQQGWDNAGKFETAIIHGVRVEEAPGQLILLLGGIGSGKTTFLRRYQRTIGKRLLEEGAFYFNLDFLAPPVDPRELEAFVWQCLLDELRRAYAKPYLESSRNLKRAYAAEIEALRQTFLQKDPPGFERLVSERLEAWQRDLGTYVPKLLALGRAQFKRTVVIFIDNVDQLAPAYQAQIFLLAQHITKALGCTTVVSLREESYYSATVQKTFTAYSSRKFHIASPRFRTLIGSRIKFAIKVLEGKAGTPDGAVFKSGIAMDKPALADFLRIVESSIFQHNYLIALFIEALCFGNMRLALQMFTTFLDSGVTDVDKMLRIYRREGAYYVAYHEFVKSIMLGDRRYYRESQSPILNVFDCGPGKNASHFTTARLLKYLLSFRGVSTPEGPGYCDIAQTVQAMEDVFDDREEVVRALNRMLAKQLIEVDTRSTVSIGGASGMRATSAGWYYVRHLVPSFAYLDLVLQDTPLNSTALKGSLKRSVVAVDNLSGREEDKLDRLRVRVQRVDEFLRYLGEEERIERERYGLGRVRSVVADEIVAEVRKHFDSERSWITRRVQENRDRFEEDARDATSADAITQGVLDEDPADDLPSEQPHGES